MEKKPVEIIIKPGGESYIRSGLAKSAFKESIYQGFSVSYYIPHISEVQKLVRELQLWKRKISPHLYQAHDSFLMFYKPYHLVYSSLKKSNKLSPLWLKIVTQAVNDEKFYDLNKITQTSTELSIISATKFLLRLIKEADIDEIQRKYDQMQKILQQHIPDMERNRIENELKDIERLFTTAVKTGIEEAVKSAQEYKEGRETVESAVSSLLGSGGLGYTKEALSIWSFLRHPDMFRKKVNILRHAKIFFNRFMTITPSSAVHQHVENIYGGVNGASRMISERQLPDVFPSEMAMTQLGDVGRALFAVKLVQRQLTVYKRLASIKPVVFLDKSGSMAEIYTGSEKVPKISVASGLALALYRKLDADIYLFDTEVEKVKPENVIKTLLEISADGGTDIDPVLEEIMRIGKKDYTYIIISDGITEANEDVLERFRKNELTKNTKLILIPPAGVGDRYRWVELLRGYKNVFFARDVASFEESVKEILR